MWRWAVDLAKVRRARRAAGAVISPLVEKSRSRLGEIPAIVWSDPYIVGFTFMLITIVARIEIGKIEGRALCFLQAKAWEDITAMPPGTIGEDVILLSAARNRDFETGCRDAMTFGSMLVGNSILFAGMTRDWQDRHLDLQETELAATSADHADLAAAWEQFFDPHVSMHVCNSTSDLGRAAL